MYLSRLKVSLENRRVQALLTNPYECHQVLALACASGPDQKPSRILFRVEPEANESQSILLVQSVDEPHWNRLELAEKLPILSAESKPIHPKLARGGCYHFRLRANPTVKREGKRWPIIKDEDLRIWLERKFLVGGARLSGVTIIQEGKREAVKRRQIEKNPVMTFSSVRFEGVLQVEDSDKLLELVRQGVGSAKGFGFGLLSLAPAGK